MKAIAVCLVESKQRELVHHGVMYNACICMIHAGVVGYFVLTIYELFTIYTVCPRKSQCVP